MQLPRGTFREIKKNQKAADILGELDKTRFSGICSLSSRTCSGTLILKAGKCVLAEYSTVKGDAALVQLLQAFADSEIDAALSTLDEAQLQLALEFNTNERVVKTGRAIPPAHKPLPPPVFRAPPKKERASPVPPDPLPVTPPRIIPPAPAVRSEKPIRIPPPDRPPAARPAPAGVKSETHSAHKKTALPERDTSQNTGDSSIDSLDLENLEKMTDKIRNDCKTMVKDLQLDYLMDRD